MTLAEKIGQMTQANHLALSDESDIADYALGSLLAGGGGSPATGNSPQDWADMVDRYQSTATSTRLGIPIIFGVDAVHGHNNVYGATIFPHNIGLGATRNPDLVREIGEIMDLSRERVRQIECQAKERIRQIFRRRRRINAAPKGPYPQARSRRTRASAG